MSRNEDSLMKKKTKVYISGRITGMQMEKARKMFLKAEKELRDAGYEPVNPFNSELPESSSWEDYMKDDIKMLMDCDMIYLLRGWYKSRGAKLEARIAKKVGIKYLIKIERQMKSV